MREWADHTYVINREDRVDRKEHAINQLDNIGLSNGDYTIWKACTPENTKIEFKEDKNMEGWNINAAGLVLSTINILEDAKEKGYDRIMILEDDVLFVANAAEKAEYYRKRLDSTHWDLFHFGHMAKLNRPSKPLGKGLVRLRGSYMCHAYVIQSRIFDDMLALLKPMDKPLDWVTADVIHRGGRSYSVEPAIATQKPDYSNIREENVNYKLD
jgi:GR25 family glycosyltransferase involved in LPS biosynthesis